MIRIDERLKNKPFTFVLVYHLADDMSITGSFRLFRRCRSTIHHLDRPKMTLTICGNPAIIKSQFGLDEYSE